MAAPVSSPLALLTLDEFAALPDADAPMELVRGEVRSTPPINGPAAAPISNVTSRLLLHAHPRAAGRVYGPNTGFALPGTWRTVRTPDVAFVRAGRLADPVTDGWLRVTPDLAVEVLDADETASSLEDRVADYREAGTSVIWVVDPERRFVTVHPADAFEGV